MGRFKVPPGWVCQAYRFEIDRPSDHPVIASHQGARRFAWNWALSLIEEQLHARDVFRVLAIRQGASIEEAEEYAAQAAAIPYLVELNDQRQKTHEARVAPGRAKDDELHLVSEWCPWTKEAMRYIWNRVKDEVAPWWAENSKECYSSAFESLAQAFKDHFASRDGIRKGSAVGWRSRLVQVQGPLWSSVGRVYDRGHRNP